jgi:hypothetical protein
MGRVAMSNDAAGNREEMKKLADEIMRHADWCDVRTRGGICNCHLDWTKAPVPPAARQTASGEKQRARECAISVLAVCGVKYVNPRLDYIDKATKIIEEHAAHVAATARKDALVLAEALRKLANEASGFRSMADINRHGATNMKVLGDRVTEAFEALAQSKEG